MRRALFVFVLVAAALLTGSAAAQAAKPRVILTADPEKDDNNSLMRYLLYADWFDTEALVLTSSQYHWKGDGLGTRWQVAGREYTRADFPGGNPCPCTSWRWPVGPSIFEQQLDAYEAIYPNLKVHSAEYPTPAYLKSIYKVGNIEFDADMSKDTPGSDKIKEILLDDEPGPVFTLAWGGMSSIARALRSIELQYKDTPQWAAIYDKVSRKTVLQTSGDQDNLLANYIRPNWPLIRTGITGGNGGAGGGLAYGAQSSATPANRPYYGAEWTKRNILDVGPLGALLYTWGDGREMVAGDITDFFWLSGYTRAELQAMGYYVWTNPLPKGEFLGEGDTGTFMNLLGNGMRSYERAGWGNYTGGRYLPHSMNELATRLQWGQKAVYDDANHAPVVTVDGPLDITAAPGEVVRLNATATDPDGDALTYSWYEDTGSDTYTGTLTPSSTNALATSVEVPAGSVVPPNAVPGQTIHMVLEVVDNGTPALARYQRVVITVSARATQYATATVAPVLALTLGAAPNLGALVPGTARAYTGTSTATVTSTAGDAVLSVQDLAPVNSGRLVNGAFALTQPLQVNGAALGGAPVAVKTYTEPVTADVASLTFSQSVLATDTLRTGAYGKALTYTLSTTTP